MDVIYLFTADRTLRSCIVSGISECIHDEGKYTLTAKIPIRYDAKPGESLGFLCVDGRFRLFDIDEAQDDEDEGSTTCTATDAAVSELIGTVVSGVKIEKARIAQAAEAILRGKGWTIRSGTQGPYETDVKFFVSDAWSELETAARDCGVRLIPSFEFDGTGISAKVIDITAKESAFAGRIYENGIDAQNAIVTRSTNPRPKVYGLGATDENDEQLTFADVEWSREKGDPADKPKGQTWIGEEEAMRRHPGRAKIYELVRCRDKEKLLRYTWEEAQREAAPRISVSLTVSDMELAQGQSFKSIRMYDIAAMHTARGETIAKTIIDIRRDYVRPERTQIDLGEEDEREPDIAQEVAQIEQETRKAGRGGSGAGAAAEKNYALIKAQETRIDGNELDISTVFVELDAVNTTLTLKASLQELQETNKRVSDAEIRLDGAEADILLKASREEVEDIDSRLTQAEIDIDGANAQILLKASQTVVDELGERVSSAEISIDGLNSEIELKADRIDLRGYVTASEFSALESDIAQLLAGTVQASHLYTQNLTATNTVRLSGYTCVWKKMDVVTGVSISKDYASVPGANGVTYTVISGVSLSKSTEEIKYFGRD